MTAEFGRPGLVLRVGSLDGIDSAEHLAEASRNVLQALPEFAELLAGFRRHRLRDAVGNLPLEHVDRV